MSKVYVILEVTPALPKDNERLVVVRDSLEDINKILKILEETNINFDYYIIREHIYD